MILQFHEVVEATNCIRDFIDSKMALNSHGEGLAHLRRGQIDILVNAVDTRSVRGFSQSKTFNLAAEIGAPAVIQLQIGVPHGSSSLTHVEYLLVKRGDDPVRLFLACLRDFIDHNRALNTANLSSFLLDR